MKVILRVGAGSMVLGVLLACLDSTSPQQEELFSVPSLSGAAERPQPVTTAASGTFLAAVGDTATVAGKKDSLAVLRFSLIVQNIDAATAAHIHAGGPDDAGPVMVFLFSGPTTGSGFTGELSNGQITRSSSFTAPFTLDSVLARMRNGTAYVNVHTTANPPGEIRGQVQRN